MNTDTTTWSIGLGDKVRDTVSGYEGKVICRSEWLNGCKRITLQSTLDKDGKLPDPHTFDIDQLEVLATAASQLKKEKPTGGPQSEPVRHPDPTR